MDDPVLLVAEVAKELRCSRRYVTTLCVTGRLRSFRVGREFRVTRSALDEYKATESVAS